MKRENYKKVFLPALLLVVVLLSACILEFLFFYLPHRMNGEEKQQIQLLVNEENENIWKLDETYVEYINLKAVASEDVIIGLTFYNDGKEIKHSQGVFPYALGSKQFLVANTIDEIQIQTQTQELDQIHLSVVNEYHFNWMRILFFVAVIGLISFFIFNRSWFVQKVEWVYVLFSMTFGLLLILGIGTNQVSFDEQIHATTAYNASFMNEVRDTDASLGMKTLTIPSFSNQSERKEVEHYLDQMNDYDHSAISTKSKFLPFDKRSYLPISFGFAVARMASFSFAGMIALGKIFGLLLYTTVCFWAIRLSKQGKILVAAIALIPNSIFIASSISYDGVVTCFLLLGSVLLINEILDPNRELSMKNAFLMLAAFIIGSTAKQIYILMTFVILFFGLKKIPGRFRNGLFKGIVVMIGLSMLYYVVFPPVVDTEMVQMAKSLTQAGDSRVQGTSVLGQLQYIFGNPFEYAELLLQSMFFRVLGWFSGQDQFMIYGYLGHSGVICTIALFVTLFFAAFFSPNEEERIGIKNWMKVILFLMVTGMSVVVWTSLYMSFNPVGNHSILGVQNRYFIPLFLPFFAICFNQKCKISWSKEHYHKAIFAVLAMIHLVGVIKLIMIPYYMFG